MRGIRSYMGANSGPLTQRLHLFYEGRQDVTTFLRVHAIPGMMDLYDYSPAAQPVPIATAGDPRKPPWLRGFRLFLRLPRRPRRSGVELQATPSSPRPGPT